MDLTLIQSLAQEATSKIVLLVMDGLGGLALSNGGETALEAADTPHLDELAREGECGLHEPVGPGITPGSGPGHLALFGYDPIQYQVGRGVLSALGVGFDLQPHDVAARGNFATMDADGLIEDRRAGRISTETNAQLCERLKQIALDDAEVFVQTVKEHRFLLVLRGEGLTPPVSDTDPEQTGMAPHDASPQSDKAERLAKAVNEFVRQAREILKDQHPANMILLRGFASLPAWPRLPDVCKFRPAAVAAYPMYKGVSKLIGMDVLATGDSLEDHTTTLKSCWNDHDFFYVHFKKTDSAGEDGDFDRKVGHIAEVDRLVPRLRDLNPDVIVVTGDHSTPAAMKFHSWHPVPTLLWSRRARSDAARSFGERECMRGALGARFPATDLLSLALAHAGRLSKFGA